MPATNKSRATIHEINSQRRYNRQTTTTPALNHVRSHHVYSYFEGRRTVDKGHQDWARIQGHVDGRIKGLFKQ